MKLKLNLHKMFSFILKMFIYIKKKIYFNCWETKKNKHQEYQHLLGV